MKELEHYAYKRVQYSVNNINNHEWFNEKVLYLFHRRPQVKITLYDKIFNNSSMISPHTSCKCYINHLKFHINKANMKDGRKIIDVTIICKCHFLL